MTEAMSTMRSRVGVAVLNGKSAVLKVQWNVLILYLEDGQWQKP